MAGIENITSLIKQDAENTAAEIISNAKSKAEELNKQAHKDADEKISAVVKSQDVKFASIIERAKSSAELEKRKSLLSAKQEVISEIIEKAKESLENLPDDEYFDLLIKLVGKYSTEESGSIALGAKDLKRVPSDFEAKANAVSKGKLTLSKDSINIKNGFLLLYGGIDINCTFDSLFDEKNEEILDKVTHIVF